MTMRGIVRASALLVTIAAGGCSAQSMGVEPEAQLAAVYPPGGSVDVSVDGTITVAFTHPMMAGMEAYLALQEGDVTGPLVPGTWTWSQDRTSSTFAPSVPLQPGTVYTIHVGGGLRTDMGQPVGFEMYGMQMGGQWATGNMMQGGMGPSMMGPGWLHGDGTFGMVFTFMTA
jgi:hypothetical protein